MFLILFSIVFPVVCSGMPIASALLLNLGCSRVQRQTLQSCWYLKIPGVLLPKEETSVLLPAPLTSWRSSPPYPTLPNSWIISFYICKGLVPSTRKPTNSSVCSPRLTGQQGPLFATTPASYPRLSLLPRTHALPPTPASSSIWVSSLFFLVARRNL